MQRVNEVPGIFPGLCRQNQQKPFYNPNHPAIVEYFVDILPMHNMKRRIEKAV